MISKYIIQKKKKRLYIINMQYTLRFNYFSSIGIKCKLPILFYFVFFSGFFPVAINFMRRVPLLGTVLNLPGISGVS